jgi:mono/diheme cytochrome c family protein
MGTKPLIVASAAFALAVVSFVVGVAEAQTIKREAAKRVDSIEGVDTFRAYCAVCHGEDAKGKGPAAPALKTVPADLTQIARRNGGRFSQIDIERWILGKDENLPASHGSREMPIWGPVFRDTSVDRAEATLRLNNLINYLKSIQVQ